MADLDELRALLDVATEAPWTALIDRYGEDTWPGSMFITADPSEGQAPLCRDLTHADAALIVWLRNHAESLLDDSLDAARLARAIHRTGIANCRNECRPVDAPYSGADADMAVFLAREYASESPEGKTP